MTKKENKKSKIPQKVTFQVEEIPKATALLKEVKVEEILNKFSNNIEAYNKKTKTLVEIGTHPFLQGMHRAYADHRPFVISPDMIWLLICQGFSRHINNNKEKLRNKIVDFEGITQLTIISESVGIGDPSSQWEDIFPEFTKSLEEHVNNDLIKILSSNFSTTTSVEKVVSEITILETLKPYFDYVVIRTICGIPEITLEGDEEDWGKIIEKTKQLGKYDLTWWTDELISILKKIKESSKGRIDVDFWRNMFKIHTSSSYGWPKTIIDGWVNKFYPYYKDGDKRNLESMSLSAIKYLPDEIVSVDFVVKDIDDFGEGVKEYQMEFNGGFLGLYQDKETLSLRPEMSWFISHQSKEEPKISKSYDRLIYRNAIDFPQEILKQKKIRELDIRFIEPVRIPEELKNVKIDFLELPGFK